MRWSRGANQRFVRESSRKHPIKTTERKRNPPPPPPQLRQINEDSLRGLWDSIKHTNIHIIGVWEEEEKQQETENQFEEIMMENFSNLVKETDIQVQEIQSPKQDEPKEAHTKTPHN